MRMSLIRCGKKAVGMAPRLKEKRIFPDVSVIRNGIRELKSFDLSSMTLSELRKKVIGHFRVIPCSYGSIDVGKKLFRARLNLKAVKSSYITPI